VDENGSDRFASLLTFPGRKKAKEFVKGLYKKGLAEYGVDADSINW